jgi:phosphatidate cytidylyltransferase
VAPADAARPAQPGSGAPLRGNNLWLRVVTSLVLAPLALGAAYAGGPLFLAFWSLAALGVLWEWQTLVCAADRAAAVAVGGGTLAGAALLLAFDWPAAALALVFLGLLGIAAVAAGGRRAWCLSGLAYAAALLFAPVALRGDPVWGLPAILFIFVIVWLTDIAAYFAGRAIGGPKLLPQISPNKTWSGAIGGAAAAVAGGLLLAWQAGAGHLGAIALVALALSIVSQAGDLLESAVKRRFGAKDSSALIPGHGGLMDRLDGFVAAATAALLIGLAHGGTSAPGRGLMVW